MILAAIDDHEELQNGDFLILFLVLSAFISNDGKTFLTNFLVTLKYSLHRNGHIDNYFFPFIYK